VYFDCGRRGGFARVFPFKVGRCTSCARTIDTTGTIADLKTHPMCRRRIQFAQASRSIKPKDHVANPARMNNQYRGRPT